MNEKIMIETEDGEKREAEALLYFTLDEFDKEYILYTFNEEDDNGLITMHAATVSRQDGEIIFDNVETDEEWKKIKEVMKYAIKEGQEE